MLAFIADYVDGDITPQPGEIESACWFDLDALPELPSQASIAHWLIHRAVDILR
jgi:NAD+ diphosphatase